MTTVIARNFNKEELDDVKCNLMNCYLKASSIYVNSKFYALPCSKEEYVRLFYMYLLVLEDWEQNDNGTTDGYTNYITQEEFTNMIYNIKEVCGGCC